MYVARSRTRALLALAGVLCLAGLMLFMPSGCATNTPPSNSGQLAAVDRVMRVRIVVNADQVLLASSQAPSFYTAADRNPRQLVLPPRQTSSIAYTAQGWKIGSALLGSGEMTLIPQGVGTLSVAPVTGSAKAYRGQLRLVPTGSGRFDVVNDVDLDDYLKGVLAAELFAKWEPEAFRAQAIVARTYALYEKNYPRGAREWDVFADTRSQVYGGLASETPKAIEAVDSTSGVVLAYGPAGQERIFKAYFSSCCGGVSQSNADAFNEPLIEPLSARNTGQTCNASPRFNWGPIVVTKEELTRRFRQWGENRGRAERDMGLVRQIGVERVNSFQRPVRYFVIDSKNLRYSWGSEELRWAVNTQAQEGTTLFSSYIENVVTESDRIRFIGGHGYGHGVGMCQWCVQSLALKGMRHEDIVLWSYPGAKLVKAY